ncbi:hypothetical protein, partial [Latilactobacillus curvatus]|uniref:hypothetical protein n=1 Tax=Latilactobacillus curvatus TaxID=28038 RepID=UPI00240F6CD6
MTIINGIFFFLIFNKLSTYINPTWKWLSALEPSAFIALLALITTLVTFSITSMNNRKNSFENLFFHLISLLREILKLDENGSKNRLLCQESGHKSTNKFDFQFKLLNLIFGGRSFR